MKKNYIKLNKIIFAFLKGVGLVLLHDFPAYALSLPEYLDQVQRQNIGYNAANQQDQAFELIRKKAKLVTAPNFFATAESAYNEQNTALPFFRYNRLTTQTYSTGISHTAPFGLESKFTFALNKYVYNGLTASNPLASYNYQTRPSLELAVPMLQGRFGSLVKARQDLFDSQNEAQKYTARATAISTLIEAEQSYWRLVLARRVLQIQQNAESQAQKIYDYVKKKEMMNLGETADVLQAKALVETRKLEVRQAQNDLRHAARLFNRYRYIDSDVVDDALQIMDLGQVDKVVISQVKPSTRPDVKAAQANMRAAVANAKIEEENAKPSLNLYGSYAFKGVQGNANPALDHAFDARGRERAVGIKFSVPFYFGTMIDIQQGAKKTAAAAKDVYRQKTFDEANDWQELLAQILYYQDRTLLARKIEVAQKNKLENERRLLKQGRTSTYQILLFEQEFSQSQLNLVNSTAQFFILMAQKKLYD